jgi:transcriptional regulator with XRE-family HTH domain
MKLQHTLKQVNANALAYERFVLEATEIICRILKKRNISRTELAKRMGVHQVQVTKMLAGQKRVGIRSLTKAFHALGYSMHVALGPTKEGVRIPEFLRMEDDP